MVIPYDKIFILLNYDKDFQLRGKFDEVVLESFLRRDPPFGVDLKHPLKKVLELHQLLHLTLVKLLRAFQQTPAETNDVQSVSNSVRRNDREEEESQPKTTHMRSVVAGMFLMIRTFGCARDGGKGGG